MNMWLEEKKNPMAWQKTKIPSENKKVNFFCVYFFCQFAILMILITVTVERKPFETIQFLLMINDEHHDFIPIIHSS